MEKYILLLFTENLFDEDINLMKLDEQLQISMQILINKGFKIFVSGDGNESYEFAKSFVHIFQDKNISITETEYTLNTLKEDNLIKMISCVICFEADVEYLTRLLNSSCVFIDIKDNDENKYDDKLTMENLNAGELVRRVEELINYKCCRNTESINNYKKNLNNEFEGYKSQIKKTIEQLINGNKLEDAKNMIVEYEDIVKDDEDIYSMKGIIAIMKGDIQQAYIILNEGLRLYPISFDLLYNLGYIYEIQKKYTHEYLYYKKAFLVADEENKNQLESKISQLEDIEEVREYKAIEESNIVTEMILVKMKKQIAELEAISGDNQ